MSVALGEVSLADVVRYAGASGDLNPIHYDREFARASGHDDVFSMGALHGGWLISQSAAEGAIPESGPYRVRLRFTGIVPLGRPLSSQSSSSDDVFSNVLTMDGTPVVTAYVEKTGLRPDVEQPRIPAQECSFPVELGAARRFALAVRWPGPVGPGDPVPPTFLSVLTFFLPHPDPIERIEFDRSRTLLGETTIDFTAGPLRIGETFEVREYVTDRRTKDGSRGRLELADVVADLHDDSGLRVRYRNTFVLTPAEPDARSTARPTTLTGSRDPLTGEVYFPTRKLSVDGRLRELDDVELSREGVLYSWTSFDGKAYGQVDLPEGVRIQGPLAPGEHEIGATYLLAPEAENGWCFARA